MLHMKQFLNKFTKRVIVCTSCGQRTRVPIKPGKVLLVICPSCNHKFEIAFEKQQDSIKRSFDQLISRYVQSKELKQTIYKYLPFIMVALMLMMFNSCFVAPNQKNTIEPPIEYKENRQFDKQDTNSSTFFL